MATITSTIKLVDQMTPTLNKIAKAINTVKNNADGIGKAVENSNARAVQSTARAEREMLALQKASANARKAEAQAQLAEERLAAQRRIQTEREVSTAKTKAEREALAAERAAKKASEQLARQEAQIKKQAEREERARALETARLEKQAEREERARALETARLEKQAEREALQLARQAEREKRALARETARIQKQQERELLNATRERVRQTNSMISKISSFNRGLNTTRAIANGVTSAFRRLLSTLAMIVGVRALVETADSMMNASARIQNLTGNLSLTEHYLDEIYAAAQRSRGSFLDMTASVSKLATLAGHAFDGSIDQAIAFTELMNKLFVISGSSGAEASNAMYQLTQAMAAGKLQGDEMRSIMENAPMLAQKIADKLGVTTGEVKELGAEGKITAEVIKEALFECADEIEEKFSAMPKTIAQTWTEIANYAVNAFRPVIGKIQSLINSPTFEKVKSKVYGVIDGIADGVIKLTTAFQMPGVQKSIDKITSSLATLWDVAVQVGNTMVSIAIWIGENWNWLAPIVAAVVGIMILYNIVSAIASVVSFLFSASLLAVNAQGVVTITVFGWIVLAIIAVILVIYLAVAAWNHFTGQSVSATGIIFGSIMFVIACVVDLVVFLWDILCTIWDGLVLLFQWIWNTAENLFSTLIRSLVNLIMGVIATLATIFAVIGIIFEDIGASFWWLLQVIGAFFSAALDYADQYVDRNKALWQLIKWSIALAFWSAAETAYEAFHNMIENAGTTVKDVISPFVDFYNSIVDILQKVAKAWNDTFGGLGSFEIRWPDWLGGGTWTFGGIPTMNAPEKLNVNDVVNSVNNLGNTISSKRSAAESAVKAYSAKATKKLEWRYHGPEYDVDWTDNWDTVSDLWKELEFTDPFEEWSMDDYTEPWKEFKEKIENVWDSDAYWNPLKAFEDGYEAGKALDEGVAGLIEGIGALLDGLRGSGKEGAREDGYYINGDLFPNNPAANNPASDSLEELLGGSGYSPTDSLGAIADNTGKTAGSTGNIEETLDLAEEELELLRKLAEQEVINRFTTAEIHVDMTNNNNVSSNMDLDGIVTHLSNKLYEELGVVASGVHY